MAEEKFLDLFEKNWDLIILALIAAIIFEIMNYGRNPLEKSIFAIFSAIIMVSVYTSFLWAQKKKNKFILIALLCIFWLIALYIIIQLIPLLVFITGHL